MMNRHCLCILAYAAQKNRVLVLLCEMIFSQLLLSTLPELAAAAVAATKVKAQGIAFVLHLDAYIPGSPHTSSKNCVEIFRATAPSVCVYGIRCLQCEGNATYLIHCSRKTKFTTNTS